MEEERRLAYVGITRAKKKAIISFSMNRFYQGDWIDSMASRFIEELPENYLEKNSFFEDETCILITIFPESFRGLTDNIFMTGVSKRS